MPPRRTIDLQAAGRGIVIKIEGDGESARKALEMVQQQMRETEERTRESASGMAEAWERVRGAIESVGLYMGVREALEGIKELVGGSMELGEQMVQTAQRTGLTVDTLSTLHYAAAVTGQDFEGLVNGIGKMNRTIGEAADGNKKASGFIQALGLNAKDLAGRADGAEIAFHRFVETLAATENPIRRNELAMGLLGRAGSAQIPVLIEIAEHWDEFRAKAEAAGVQLNQQTAQALAEANQRMKDLEEHIRGAGLALTEGMAPGLTQIFSIISGGKSQLDQMNQMGVNLSKTFAFVGEVFYSAAAAAEGLFATVELGSLTEAGRRDQAAMRELKQKADALHDIAFGNGVPKSAPLLTGTGSGPTGPGFGGADGQGGGKGKGPKSDNSIADAQAALAAEQAKAAADAVRVFDEQRLAELETQHKLLLVSDQEFYAEKLALQNEMLDAQENALKSRSAALQQLYERQHGDKTLHRDKSGVSAEELRTQRELLQVQEQMGALEAKRAQDASANTAETGAAGRAAELANLRAAAELERQRNDGITARLALLQRETDMEAEKLAAQGGTQDALAQVRALGQVKQAQLEIADVERQIADTEDSYRLKQQDVQDREQKGYETKRQAERELNQLREQEVAQLATLVQQYEQLAATLGGPYKQKAEELQAELTKLSRPDKKQDNAFGDTLAKGVTSLADRITEQAIRGKTSFKDMAREIEAEAARLALKLIALQFEGGASSGGAVTGSGGGFGGGLNDFFGKIFGAFGEHHMSGGVGSGGPQVVGEAGPEVWTPPTRGGSYTPNNVLTKLADSGGGGKAPNVQTNIVNQTREAVTAQPSKVSYDAEARQFIIHTVLESASSGGDLSHLNPNNQS